MLDDLVLVVEDSEDDAMLTLRAIRQVTPRHSVLVARDGVAAAEILGLGKVPNSNAAKPALVLLDVQMPKMNGLELLKLIRGDARMADLQVVMFSSSNMQVDVDRARDLKATFEQKLIDYSEYLAKVKVIVEGALLVSQAFVVPLSIPLAVVPPNVKAMTSGWSTAP